MPWADPVTRKALPESERGFIFKLKKVQEIIAGHGAMQGGRK